MRILILLLPWLELFTLVQFGIETGAFTVLLYVFATFLLGGFILRRQGEGMFLRLREAQQGRVLNQQLLADDMSLGVAGLLLMIPGLITDAMALVVLFGPLRRKLARALGPPRAEPYAPQLDPRRHETIEGNYRRLDE